MFVHYVFIQADEFHKLSSMAISYPVPAQIFEIDRTASFCLIDNLEICSVFPLL